MTPFKSFGKGKLLRLLASKIYSLRMAKRKRDVQAEQSKTSVDDITASKVTKTNGHLDVKTPGPLIQIVTGSYERVLHGITASVADLTSSSPSAQFADAFLFNAHASAIRCVAISPLPQDTTTDASTVYLATGGSDERVNVYSLSASPLPDNDKLPSMPTIGNNKISENPLNRELGTLMQHSSNITALHFPTRSKLISASEDNTIAISRTRDLTAVSTIKAPRPKVQGQPSGDTAPPGATPAGINDFAIHPSMKLMISVGRGERCMRLWNLVTGKKASILNFSREALQAAKESKYSSGEGRRIRWNSTASEFAIAFERGVVIYGENAEVKGVVLPQPLTKIHQIAYHDTVAASRLALSTEDGRIIFYDTSDLKTVAGSSIPLAKAVAQLGGRQAQLAGRVKDFKVLDIAQNDKDGDKDKNPSAAVVIAGSSDGAIRLWSFKPTDLTPSTQANGDKDQTTQIGKLIGTYETGNRITCLDAFIMLPAADVEVGLSEFEGLTEPEEEEASSSDSDEE